MRDMAPRAAALLCTAEVAELLCVHPKHVYRLLKRGLPARRVGSEWRLDRAEVLAWSRPAVPAPAPPPRELAAKPLAPGAPPLIAANGDRGC